MTLVDEDDVPRVAEECYAPLRGYWPLGAGDKPAARYHEAVTQFDTPPDLWFNAPSYRLLGIERRSWTTRVSRRFASLTRPAATAGSARTC
ncbi:MAG TPA: hypothetical protein VF223_21030 [Trebonia sp.]